MRQLIRTLTTWLAFGFRANPALALLGIVLSIGQAVLPVITVGALAHLVDSVTTGSPSAAAVATVAVSLVGTALTGRVVPLVTETLNDSVSRQVHLDLMHFASETANLAHFEDPALVDKMHLLHRDAYRLSGIQHILTMVGAVAAVVTVGGLLWQIHPLLTFLVLTALVPSIASSYGMFQQGQIGLENERYRRVGDAAQQVLSDPKAGVEVRSYGLLAPLLSLIALAKDRQMARRLRVLVRSGTAEALGHLLHTMAYAGGLIWVSAHVAARTATLGDLTVLLLVAPQVTSAATAVAGAASAVVDGGRTFSHYLWLSDWMDGHPKHAQLEPPDRLHTGIQLVDVTFAYPGQARNSLSHVDLDLPAGSVVVIVGENGAGKTTLVKLLAQFYRPTSGTVLIDGVPLDDLDPQLWHGRLSAGFQDFARFEFTARRSIAPDGLDDQDHLLDPALRHSGADEVVTRLPSRLETQLGTQFDGGVGLSGGQWQRIALARAFRRQNPLLLLLDEPTSALDPKVEHRIYEGWVQRAHELGHSHGTITLIVSHRLSTAQLADRVIVMEHGQVIDSGTHQDLVTQPGPYRDLFELQAKPYQ